MSSPSFHVLRSCSFKPEFSKSVSDPRPTIKAEDSPGALREMAISPNEHVRTNDTSYISNATTYLAVHHGIYYVVIIETRNDKASLKHIPRKDESKFLEIS
jgi:hypothetical protein